MSTLEHAIQVAVEAHAGQTNKAGEAFILHPLRVMFAVGGESSRIVAVLHDLLEHCPAWTAERLRANGFDDVLVRAIVALTRQPNESFDEALRRGAADSVARPVKIADLRDNLAMSRRAATLEQKEERIRRYERALAAIEGGLL